MIKNNKISASPAKASKAQKDASKKSASKGEGTSEKVTISQETHSINIPVLAGSRIRATSAPIASVEGQFDSRVSADSDTQRIRCDGTDSSQNNKKDALSKIINSQQTLTGKGFSKNSNEPLKMLLTSAQPDSEKDSAERPKAGPVMSAWSAGPPRVKQPKEAAPGEESKPKESLPAQSEARSEPAAKVTNKAVTVPEKVVAFPELPGCTTPSPVPAQHASERRPTVAEIAREAAKKAKVEQQKQKEAQKEIEEAQLRASKEKKAEHLKDVAAAKTGKVSTHELHTSTSTPPSPPVAAKVKTPTSAPPTQLFPALPNNAAELPTMKNEHNWSQIAKEPRPAQKQESRKVDEQPTTEDSKSDAENKKSKQHKVAGKKGVAQEPLPTLVSRESDDKPVAALTQPLPELPSANISSPQPSTLPKVLSMAEKLKLKEITEEEEKRRKYVLKMESKVWVRISLEYSKFCVQLEPEPEPVVEEPPKPAVPFFPAISEVFCDEQTPVKKSKKSKKEEKTAAPTPTVNKAKDDVPTEPEPSMATAIITEVSPVENPSTEKTEVPASAPEEQPATTNSSSAEVVNIKEIEPASKKEETITVLQKKDWDTITELVGRMEITLPKPSDKIMAWLRNDFYFEIEDGDFIMSPLMHHLFRISEETENCKHAHFTSNETIIRNSTYISNGCSIFHASELDKTMSPLGLSRGAMQPVVEGQDGAGSLRGDSYQTGTSRLRRFNTCNSMKMRILSTLNKVSTSESHYKIVRDELLRLPLEQCSEEELRNEVVAPFFKKAIVEHQFTEIYARLIADLCPAEMVARKDSLCARLRHAIVERCDNEFAVCTKKLNNSLEISDTQLEDDSKAAVEDLLPRLINLNSKLEELRRSEDFDERDESDLMDEFSSTRTKWLGLGTFVAGLYQHRLISADAILLVILRLAFGVSSLKEQIEVENKLGIDYEKVYDICKEVLVANAGRRHLKGIADAYTNETDTADAVLKNLKYISIPNQYEVDELQVVLKEVLPAFVNDKTVSDDPEEPFSRQAVLSRLAYVCLYFRHKHPCVRAQLMLENILDMLSLYSGIDKDLDRAFDVIYSVRNEGQQAEENSPVTVSRSMSEGSCSNGMNSPADHAINSQLSNTFESSSGFSRAEFGTPHSGDSRHTPLHPPCSQKHKKNRRAIYHTFPPDEAPPSYEESANMLQMSSNVVGSGFGQPLHGIAGRYSGNSSPTGYTRSQRFESGGRGGERDLNRSSRQKPFHLGMSGSTGPKPRHTPLGALRSSFEKIDAEHQSPPLRFKDLIHSENFDRKLEEEHMIAREQKAAAERKAEAERQNEKKRQEEIARRLEEERKREEERKLEVERKRKERLAAFDASFHSLLEEVHYGTQGTQFYNIAPPKITRELLKAAESHKNEMKNFSFNLLTNGFSEKELGKTANETIQSLNCLLLDKEQKVSESKIAMVHISPSREEKSPAWTDVLGPKKNAGKQNTALPTEVREGENGTVFLENEEEKSIAMDGVAFEFLANAFVEKFSNVMNTEDLLLVFLHIQLKSLLCSKPKDENSSSAAADFGNKSARMLILAVLAYVNKKYEENAKSNFKSFVRVARAVIIETLCSTITSVCDEVIYNSALASFNIKESENSDATAPTFINTLAVDLMNLMRNIIKFAKMDLLLYRSSNTRVPAVLTETPGLELYKAKENSISDSSKDDKLQFTFSQIVSNYTDKVSEEDQLFFLVSPTVHNIVLWSLLHNLITVPLILNTADLTDYTEESNTTFTALKRIHDLSKSCELEPATLIANREDLLSVDVHGSENSEQNDDLEDANATSENKSEKEQKCSDVPTTREVLTRVLNPISFVAIRYYIASLAEFYISTVQLHQERGRRSHTFHAIVSGADLSRTESLSDSIALCDHSNESYSAFIHFARFRPLLVLTEFQSKVISSLLCRDGAKLFSTPKTVCESFEVAVLDCPRLRGGLHASAHNTEASSCGPDPEIASFLTFASPLSLRDKSTEAECEASQKNALCAPFDLSLMATMDMHPSGTVVKTEPSESQFNSFGKVLTSELEHHPLLRQFVFPTMVASGLLTYFFILSSIIGVGKQKNSATPETSAQMQEEVSKAPQQAEEEKLTLAERIRLLRAATQAAQARPPMTEEQKATPLNLLFLKTAAAIIDHIVDGGSRAAREAFLLAEVVAFLGSSIGCGKGYEKAVNYIVKKAISAQTRECVKKHLYCGSVEAPLDLTCFKMLTHPLAENLAGDEQKQQNSCETLKTTQFKLLFDSSNRTTKSEKEKSDVGQGSMGSTLNNATKRNNQRRTTVKR